jgi:hypothetical protein
MLLSQIHCGAAHQLLYRQVGGYFPVEAEQADWYATANSDYLGTVMPAGAIWRFVLLNRDGEGIYHRVAAGERSSQDSAYYAMAYDTPAT